MMKFLISTRVQAPNQPSVTSTIYDSWCLNPYQVLYGTLKLFGGQQPDSWQLVNRVPTQYDNFYSRNITQTNTNKHTICTNCTGYKTTTNTRRQTRPFHWSTYFFTVIIDKGDIIASETYHVILGCRKVRLSTIRQCEDIVAVEAPADRTTVTACKFLTEEEYKAAPVRKMDTRIVFTVPSMNHNMTPRDFIHRLSMQNELPQKNIKLISKAEERMMGRDRPAFGLGYLLDVNRAFILVLKRLRWCLVADCRKIQLSPLSRIDMSSSGDDKMGELPKTYLPNTYTQQNTINACNSLNPNPNSRHIPNTPTSQHFHK